jgi:hypothetical protein
VACKQKKKQQQQQQQTFVLQEIKKRCCFRQACCSLTEGRKGEEQFNLFVFNQLNARPGKDYTTHLN